MKIVGRSIKDEAFPVAPRGGQSSRYQKLRYILIYVMKLPSNSVLSETATTSKQLSKKIYDRPIIADILVHYYQRC